MRFTAVWRHAAAPGHRAEKCADGIRHARREQLDIGARHRLVASTNARPTAAVSVKLISAIPTAAGPQLARERQVRQREAGQSGGDRADQLDAMVLQAEPADGSDSDSHGDERRRPARPEFLDDGEHRIVATPTASVGHRHMGNAAADRLQVVQERALGEVDAEDLR